ncbi:MAG: lysylphosphatidylglycerol synthase transmembrane domain-containing protein, partial [Syntrophomonadaceae bacterium]|nr:lysylphosphatidylglycerol synthase transmembrane domain-containing protein [Syntrophomonadaceae bacterium]
MYCNQWKPYKTLFKAIVSLGLLIWLGYSIQWQELGQILLDIKLYWLTVALGWIIVSMIISTYKWQMVLKAQGFNLDWVELWKAYWAGIFMNNFLPSSIGGDALRIYRVNEMTGNVSAATASVLMERVLAISGIALVGMAGAI